MRRGQRRREEAEKKINRKIKHDEYHKKKNLPTKMKASMDALKSPAPTPLTAATFTA